MNITPTPSKWIEFACYPKTGEEPYELLEHWLAVDDLARSNPKEIVRFLVAVLEHETSETMIQKLCDGPISTISDYGDVNSVTTQIKRLDDSDQKKILIELFDEN